MVQAIIFDCFGVLTSDAWLPFKRTYFGHDPELELQATDLNKQVDAGLASYDDFISSVAKLANISAAQAKKEIEDNVANELLFSYISEHLKPKYRLGILSNAGANWLDELFTPAQVALFDAVSLSCDSGFLKPDERAYGDITKQLNVSAEQSIFIDDVERYCAGAQDAGLQAVHYQGFASFTAELERLLGNSKG